ncbi:MAG: hypothetical protein DRI95_11350 [Bacteroidetes bacterium]|nr:MAG: hypothetical protein DRI95_11350 [Bacteroidota bacterium]
MKKIVLIGLYLIISNLTIAQDTLTLEKAIKITLDNNFGIKIAKNNVESMKNTAIPANANLLPRIDLSAGVNYSDNTIQTDMGETQQNATLTNTGISLSYTLFDGRANINNYKKLKEMVSASELQSRLSVESAIYQLINAYYTAVINYENLLVYSNMLDVSRRRYERAKVNKEYGKSSGLELLNSEVDYNNDSINYLNAINTLDKSKRNLNMLMSREPSIPFNTEAKLIEFQLYILPEIKNEAIENNVSYNLISNTLKQDELELKISKGAYSPVLSVNTSYGYNQSVEYFGLQLDNPNANLTAGLSLRFNIFDGGRKRKQIQNAQISIDNTQLHLEDEKIQLFTDIENSFANYEHNIRVLRTNEVNLKASKLNFDRSVEHYSLGQITSTQFREAQINYSRAKVNITISRYSAKLSEVALVYLSGNILE